MRVRLKIVKEDRNSEKEKATLNQKKMNQRRNEKRNKRLIDSTCILYLYLPPFLSISLFVFSFPLFSLFYVSFFLVSLTLFLILCRYFAAGFASHPFQSLLHLPLSFEYLSLLSFKSSLSRNNLSSSHSYFHAHPFIVSSVNSL